MTPLEIVLVGFFWIITGVFISYKREWYKKDSAPELNIFANILFAPLSLLMAFFGEFFLDKWNNNRIDK